MSEVEALKAELQKLEQDETTVTDEIKTLEQEIKTATDRKEKVKTLEADADAIKKENDETREFIATAKKELEDFPTETQVLKLERRVESLKEQIQEAKKKSAQHQTGIAAYEQRKLECATERERIVTETASCVSDVMSTVEAEVEVEKQLKPKDTVDQSCDTLCEIANEREATLDEINERIAALVKEEADAGARIAELKAQGENEIPKLDEEKDRDMREIQAEFDKECEQLQSIYDRLFSVNKEQQYHLARGTHIKQQVKSNTKELEEVALSKQQARVAASILDANQRLVDVEEDLGYQQNQAKQLRQKGRSAHAQFEADKDAALERLREAKGKLDDANSEAKTLRDLKGDLYQQLQVVRESPAAGMTPRRPARIAN